jgi:cytochrome P450
MTEKWRNHWKLIKLFDEAVMAFYEKRYQAYEYHELKDGEVVNVIDLMVHHNKKCKASGNTQDILKQSDIIGDISAFQCARLETSLAMSTTAVCRMSRDYPEWMEKICKDGLETQDQIAKNKSLGLVIKEILRLHSPILAAFFR